ncbi:plant expansin [Panaeolus papilionaceus]|nr:plant expansin [Panaeolus papilionaceus]
MRFSVLTAIVAMASTTALGAPSTQHSALEKRFDNSRMTFFFPGLGACGLVNTDADFVVALNGAQWEARIHCGQSVVINANGRTAIATIVDLCPGCPFGGLDLTPGLFQVFAPLEVGVITGSWNFL